MLDTILITLLHPLAMVLYGILMHYVKSVIQERTRDDTMTLIGYWYKYPYKSIFSILGALVGLGILADTNELTKLTAFGIGYMSDSMAEILSAKALKKINKD